MSLTLLSYLEFNLDIAIPERVTEMFGILTEVEASITTLPVIVS